MPALEKHFSWEAFDALVQYGATMIDCAGILEVSVKTIERRLKAEHEMTFLEYRELKSARMRQNLRQAQYRTAVEKDNVTMQIWLGKQMLGQTDKFSEVDPVKSDAQPVLLKYSIPGDKYLNTKRADAEVKSGGKNEVIEVESTPVDNEPEIDDSKFGGD